MDFLNDQKNMPGKGDLEKGVWASWRTPVDLYRRNLQRLYIERMTFYLGIEKAGAEARILYEIYTGKQISASQIVSILNMDKGYVSRILKKFEKDGLVNKENFSTDARVSLLALSEKGLKVFHNLNRASNDQVDALIAPLAITKQKELVMHMQEIMQLLSGQ